MANGLSKQVSSLLARELGVTAVVNAAGAMQLIRNGQMVEVGGTRGIVTLGA